MAENKHITLGQLLGSVKLALEGAFPLPVWVTAEVADLRVNPGSGHCYLELVEKAGGVAGAVTGATNGAATGAATGVSTSSVPRAQARAVVWRGQWEGLSRYFRGATGSDLGAGMKVLVRVTVGYHELYGFSLTISDIDASYTLGEAERLRRQTIERLKAEGVWDMNRGVDFPAVVQRVAVVSSSGAAGWRDFVNELGRYPWRFEVTLFEAVMQGTATEESVVGALDAIAERADDFDAVVIIRGGGSVSDLSAFDGYRLASHVAQFPLPVLTGIGHDKDRSVVDMVAALELKTPTAVAVWLGEGLGEVWGVLSGLQEDISTTAGAILERERVRLERLGRVASLGAGEMTRRLELRLERLGGEVVRLSGERFLRERHRLAGVSAVVSERPRLLLSRAGERLSGFEKVVAARRPENILALGFAVVRADGKAVFDPSTLADGQPLDITLAKGVAKARAVK